MALEDDLKRIKELNAEIAKISRQLNETPKVFKVEDLVEAERYLKGLRSELDGISESTRDLAGAFRAVVEEITGQNQGLATTKRAFRSLTSLADKFRDEQLGITKLNTKQLNQLEQKILSEKENLRQAVKLLKNKNLDLKAEAERIEKERQAAFKTNMSTKDRIKLVKNLNKEKQKNLNEQLKVNIALTSANEELKEGVSLSSELLKKVKERREEEEAIDKDRGVKIARGIEGLAKKLGLGKFSDAFKEATKAAEDQARQNLDKFGTTRGQTRAQRRAAQKQRKADLESLKTGKGLTKEAIKRLGLEKQLVSAQGKGLAGAAAASKAAKTGAASAVKPLASGISPLLAGIKALGPALMKALGPAYLLKELFDAIKSVDAITSNIAKGLNMTYNEALQVKGELTDIALGSGDIFVNSKGIAETFSFINNQLGSNVMLSEDLLVQFTKLREASGLTNEELYGATQLQLTSGKTLNKITGEILAQSDITATTLGVQINEKQVLKDIGKISAATTLSLSKNPKELSKAVTTAKALGMELSQVEKIAEGLLNFEQSITNELKAELLLGKNINLERARLAALNNEVAIVAEEIASQIGTSADFAAMNNIQQKALAEAVGMSREELAKTLFVQENLGAATGEAAEKRKAILASLVQEVGVAEAKRRLEEQSVEDLENQAGIQDRFNKSIEKLKEIFVIVAEAIMPVLDVVASVFEAIGPIMQFINPLIQMGLMGVAALADAIKGVLYIISFGAIDFGESSVLKQAERIETSMQKSYGVNLGITQAGRDAAARADDIYSGYGKRALYDEGELTLLNDKDTVIAGTDLFKPVIANDMVSMGNTIMPPSPPSTENTISQELIAQNQTMINLFRENFRRQEQQTTEQTTAIKDNKPVVDTFGERYG